MSNEHRIIVSYDAAGDVLYIRRGDLLHTKNNEDEAGLVLRYDLKTHNPVGATIVDYKEYWLPKMGHLVTRLTQFFQV